MDVAYRKKGDQAWKTGLPLLRTGGGGELSAQCPGSGGPNRYPLFKYEVPNMLSGSLLYLTPDTDYEAKLTLSDPDGGSATKTVTFHTRKEPMPASGGHVYHVYPVDWKGPKQEPNFPSLMAAYFQGGAHYDYENAYPVRVPARRHHSGPCRPLCRRPLPLPDHRAQARQSVARQLFRRHLLSHRQRHAGQAHRDQGRRRWRGDL